MNSAEAEVMEVFIKKSTKGGLRKVRNVSIQIVSQRI